MDDQATVEAQLGRSARSRSDVVARCHLQLPVVVAVPPILDDGTPFPTLYWLTCPLAVTRVSRLEADGGVRQIDARAARDSEFGKRLEAAHRRYEEHRNTVLETIDPVGPRPTGGVAGATRGIKCLHAHYADHAAGNDNPVGDLVAPSVEPLDCRVRCVVDGERNPDWSEPTPSATTGIAT